MAATVGVWYERDGYDTSGKRLVGRQAAGEQFLKALVEHGADDTLFCVAPTKEQFEDYRQRVLGWLTREKRIVAVAPQDSAALAKIGCLYRPEPTLAPYAWQRRFGDQRGYSLVGVTHTICTKAVLGQFGQLAVAPLQPWDALICTSAVVKEAVERVAADYLEFLADRYGAALPRKLDLRLPIIPLGVDASAFAPSAKSQGVRQALRTALQIGPADIAILYVGRLNFYAKAHPVPMYLAAQRAAERTGKRVCFLLTGWFENEREEKAFKESAARFCPQVSCIFLDGRLPAIRSQAWAAADIFLSLSDNIQETFGLTPLEAMASGLPVVCSDWDGYRDTVRHELDGFRIPTLAPPPGAGDDFARDYWTERLGYSDYVARTGLATAVDLDACTAALIRLISDPALRKQMGEFGIARAQGEFDWSVIIRRYEALFAELAEIRRTAQEIAPRKKGSPAHPLCDDPFRAFGHYTANHLRETQQLIPGENLHGEFLELLLADWMTHFAHTSRLAVQQWEEIAAVVQTRGRLSVAEVLQAFPQYPSEALRTLGYLLKFDVLRIAGGYSAGGLSGRIG